MRIQLFFIYGWLFIALAIEKWNLHQRIALSILKKSVEREITFYLVLWLPVFNQHVAKQHGYYHDDVSYCIVGIKCYGFKFQRNWI